MRRKRPYPQHHRVVAASRPAATSATEMVVAFTPICSSDATTASPVPGRYATFSPGATFTSPPTTRAVAVRYWFVGVSPA